MIDELLPEPATVAPLSKVRLPPASITMEAPSPSANTPAALITEPEV